MRIVQHRLLDIVLESFYITISSDSQGGYYVGKTTKNIGRARSDSR